MKKGYKVFAIMLLLVACFVAMPACGETPPQNDYISANTSGSSFSGSDVVYKNADDFKLEYLGDNNYKAVGSASRMTEEQATTWGTVANSKFIVISVKMGVGGKAIIGWRNSETMNTPYSQEEIDGTFIKNSTTAKSETKNFILALSDGDTPRHPDFKIWRIEVTEQDATEFKAFTVDFTELY